MKTKVIVETPEKYVCPNSDKLVDMKQDSTKRVARSSFYPASMNDVKKWNIKEMRICIEWAKTFDIYQKLSKYDQVFRYL